jgi:hypothetical protein
MIDQKALYQALERILEQYRESFARKAYEEENNDADLLMNIFGITPELKRENRQYWGRELGMCWQRLIVELCRQTCTNFTPALRFGADEPYDLTVGNQAIDTKYRIGSGDSGTLKKFKAYAPLLKNAGYEPVLLIMREDNLPAAITACTNGGWTVLIGEATFQYVYKLTNFDIRAYLISKAAEYKIVRQ